MFYHVNTPKYNPQQCMYIDGSFILLDDGMGHIANSWAYNPNNDLHIAKWLPTLPNVLRAKLYLSQP